MTYDILLSYAEKDNPIAKSLAMRLQEKGVTVYYDKFKEVEKWGKNSIDFDNDIFGKQGKYCIVLLSINYANSKLTRLQRRIAQNRAFSQNEDYILPIRLDNTTIEGFLDTIGDIKYYEKTEHEIVSLVCKKLGMKTNSVITNLISFFHGNQKKEKMRFEMTSSAKYSNPFSDEVQWANQRFLQVAQLKDIKIVGCEVLPYRIQVEASVENYDLIRKLYLSRELDKLTNIKWTKISASVLENRFIAPKQSPLILSSSYEEAEFDPLGETVVCHAPSIIGHTAEAERAKKILGADSTTDLNRCRVYITKSATHLYIHSNYKKPGCQYNTKIGTNTKVSLFTLFLNLTCLEYPDDSQISKLASIHKNFVQYFIDERVTDLDEKFYCGAVNIQFV